jgi:UDP-hydrolysing UDP-N-acetyl-D-glucosamine 2-epimerase
LRTIAVVTVSRSDYGIYLPVLRRIQQEPDLRLQLIVSGMHLSPEFGLTATDIEADAFPIGDRVEMLLASDSPEAVAKSMGIGTIGFAQAYSRLRPDILVVLGDRFEMHAAVVASVPFKIPVGHIHGGEVTEGATDEGLRHSITKLSHLHFVATEAYGQRVRQMGEEAWRVVISGAPGLDAVRSLTPLSRGELEARLGLDLAEPPLLVTYHPVTLEYERTGWQVQQLATALSKAGLPVVFTAPNADVSGRTISNLIQEFVQTHPRARFVANLGSQTYFSLMRYAAAMVGNSSSGIIEAASFELPVVNIGTRQKGRVRAGNVIDVGYDADAITLAIAQAVSSKFRASLLGLKNPHGDGHATERIVRVLSEITLGDALIVKRFCDLQR